MKTGVAFPVLLLGVLASSAQAQVADARRADRARQIRVDAANFQRSLPLPAHPDNGDEARFPSRFASYSKGLPHNAVGEVDTTQYNLLLRAVRTGSPADFEAITLGGERQLVNPQAAFAFVLEGTDPQALATRPAPPFTSAEAAGEMVELYWMALLRDVRFEEYPSSALAAKAARSLSALREYRGARHNGVVTPATLFRTDVDGDLPGPFISQYLLQDVPFGVNVISQRSRTRVPGDDRVTRFDEWLRIQDGEQPSAPPAFDPVRRYLRNGRDLAEWVHVDSPLQSSLYAGLLIARQGDVDMDPKASPLAFDEGSPYNAYRNQEPFTTFGNPDVQDQVARVVNQCLRTQWFQKWGVHRRLRPEEYGGRVQTTLTGTRLYPIPFELLTSPVVPLTFLHNGRLNGGLRGGTFLLSQAFPEGSPVHPAYGSGHSTFVGAGVTMLKALYRNIPVANPVVPDADGTELLPYTGPALYSYDELDKLAANVGVGRLFAGVHYRSDHDHAVRLGELCALRTLQDMVRVYNEPFPGFVVRTFGGNTLTITATTPLLPSFVSAVDGFTLIDADTDRPAPGFETLFNGAVIDRRVLAARGIRNLNIRVNTYESTVGSVLISLDGTALPPENVPPYSLGDFPVGDYVPFPLTPGTHVLKATPYSAANAGGLGGVPLTIRFTVR